MSDKTNPPGGGLPGLDPTHSPAMLALLIKMGAARHLRRQYQQALDGANRDLAGLVELPEVVADPAAKAAGQALVTAPVDQRRDPFAAFTDALVALAQQQPPGNPGRARLFALVEQATQHMAEAAEARRQEAVILERLNTVAREIEAQHALEQQQGGGLH